MSKTKKVQESEDEVAPPKLDLWSIVNSINSNKLLEWGEIEELYEPYIINKSLSYFHDTIFYADEMNRYHELPPQVQYMFLINTIRPKKRFSKWAKRDKEHSDNIAAVRKCYGYNVIKAEEALRILTPEQINMIKQKQETGGLK